jgi:replicative DNA helicase
VGQPGHDAPRPRGASLIAHDNEQRLVSSLILNEDLSVAVERGVQPDWFMTTDAKMVYEYLLSHTNKYGAFPSLATIKDDFPTFPILRVTDPTEYFVDQLVSYHRLRTAVQIAQDAAEHLRDNDYESAISQYKAGLETLSLYSPTPVFHTDLTATTDRRFDDYQARKESGSAMLGLESGYPTIDTATLGFQAEQLLVLVAPSKTGKSSICLNICRHIHETYDKVPLFISFEMSRRELELRHDAMRARVPLTRYLNGTLTISEERALADMMDDMEKRSPFILADSSEGVTISAVRAKIDDVKPDFVVIDGMYLMTDEATGESGTPQALTNLTRNLKRLAQTTQLPVMVSTQALRSKMTRGRLGADSAGYCVDDATEILTKSGWVTRHGLSVGDQVLTLNHQTGKSEWQLVKAVNVFPDQPRTMLRMVSRNHSSLTTMNHRWAVTRPVRTGSGVLRSWSTSETFRAQDAIPQRASCADLPQEAVYDDALVELVAWFWTEGSVDRYGRGHVSQSSEVNPENCDRIRGAFEKVFGPPRLDGQRSTEPMWRESPRSNRPLTDFWFNKAAGQVLLNLAPGRVPTHEFLLSLTQEQLDLFLEVSFLADGHNSRAHSGNVITQKSREMAEMVHFALVLAGRSTGIHQDRNDMWRVSWRTSPSFNPVATARLRPSTMVEVEHRGAVWCPTTDNGTWFARRDGKTYFTGNSSSFSQDADVLLGLEEVPESDQERILRVVMSRNSGPTEVRIDFDWDSGSFGELA